MLINSETNLLQINLFLYFPFFPSFYQSTSFNAGLLRSSIVICGGKNCVTRRIEGIPNSNNNEVTNNIISEYFKENERTKESVKRRSLLDLTMFKRLFFNCSVITFVCCSCFMCYYGHVQNTANLGSNNAQLLKLCIALAGRIFITGAYFISLLYASEIFPTEIRGKGMAICEFIGGFGIIFSPSIIYLSKYGNSIPIMIFCVISIMAGLMSCCLPETANHKLAQTMEDGNIFGNNQRILPWIKNSSNKEVPVIA
ncbi:SLC22A4_5 [Lepeophtheirus salmonis]|uniref:SLC22A4_5 n=1 Tax=Lepeophtheirus salmonis TaxID=72036 RepID=A0A7R8H1G0_LEPSM|nr:SLC22A4_5 [Lepeophtheirus salmonis]CAF2793656.1 SLC22A4_5 [Lepeophtheirus salmonis]